METLTSPRPSHRPAKTLFIAETTKNLGDLALRRQLHAWLRANHIEQVVQVDWNGSEDESQYIPELRGLRRSIKRAPCSVLSHVVGAHVIIGPGQMVRDNLSLASLISIAMLAIVARLTGGVVHFLGVSIGRLDNKLRLSIWRLIASVSSGGWFRDYISEERGRTELGLHDRSYLMGDLLFLEGPLNSALQQPAVTSTLVIAPAYDVGERRIVNPEAMARSAVATAKGLGLNKVVIIAHDIRDTGDFLNAVAVMKAITEQAPDLVCELIRTLDLDIVAEKYREARLVMTNRLHALVFGVIARKPLVVFDDGSEKLLAYTQRFGLRLLEAGEQLSDDELTRYRNFDPTAYEAVLAGYRLRAVSGMEACFGAGAAT
jgi:hypothetical protein